MHSSFPLSHSVLPSLHLPLLIPLPSHGTWVQPVCLVVDTSVVTVSSSKIVRRGVINVVVEGLSGHAVAHRTDNVTAADSGELAVMDEVVVHVNTHSAEVKHNTIVGPCKDGDGSAVEAFKAPYIVDVQQQNGG